MTATDERAHPATGPADTGPAEVGTLSPSRALDFMTCPLLYRFRAIDRLPERPSAEATRGTVVHAVLERLFDLPPADRTLETAAALVEAEWIRRVALDPALGALFADDLDGSALAGWLTSARELLAGYFTLEDPRRLEPAEREHYVEAVLDSGLRLRGYVDRLDRAPSGELRIVDYKTGRAPGESFEGRALFQMKFYAVVLWRTTGRLPRLLQLMYLGDREVLRIRPDETDLQATERKLAAVWTAIRRAVQGRDFRARPGRLCDWCSHRGLCPAFGGTPPPFPDLAPAELIAGNNRQPGHNGQAGHNGPRPQRAGWAQRAARPK